MLKNGSHPRQSKSNVDLLTLAFLGLHVLMFFTLNSSKLPLNSRSRYGFIVSFTGSFHFPTPQKICALYLRRRITFLYRISSSPCPEMYCVLLCFLALYVRRWPAMGPPQIGQGSLDCPTNPAACVARLEYMAESLCVICSEV